MRVNVAIGRGNNLENVGNVFSCVSSVSTFSFRNMNGFSRRDSSKRAGDFKMRWKPSTGEEEDYSQYATYSKYPRNVIS